MSQVAVDRALRIVGDAVELSGSRAERAQPEDKYRASSERIETAAEVPR